MPEMDGYEAIRRIKPPRDRAHPDRGRQLHAGRARALAAGCAGHIEESHRSAAHSDPGRLGAVHGLRPAPRLANCGLPPLRVSTCAILPAIGTMPPSSRPSWRLAGSSGSVWSPRAWTARPGSSSSRPTAAMRSRATVSAGRAPRAGAGAAAPRSRLNRPRADAVPPSRYSFGSPVGMVCNGDWLAMAPGDVPQSRLSTRRPCIAMGEEK